MIHQPVVWRQTVDQDVQIAAIKNGQRNNQLHFSFLFYKFINLDRQRRSRDATPDGLFQLNVYR
ncbi:MAG: hypothetical protein ONB27_04410 [candidate division KSB1 bacterium]|nr:hypothetical protein [candidate division KSB1 bacterium]